MHPLTTLSSHFLAAKPNIFQRLFNALSTNGSWKLYLEGIKNTLFITLIALLIGVSLGVLLALAKNLGGSRKDTKINPFWRFLKLLADLYTTVIRGTPVAIQLLIIYFVIFAWVPRDGKLLVAALAFGLNSAAYVSEIIRGGILSIDKGQMEAGRSLGLSYGKTMRLVVLPQAVRNILPALFNEFIALLKETSVAGYVAIRDITKAGEELYATDYRMEYLFISAIIYLIIVVGLTQVQKIMERRLANHA